MSDRSKLEYELKTGQDDPVLRHHSRGRKPRSPRSFGGLSSQGRRSSHDRSRPDGRCPTARSTIRRLVPDQELASAREPGSPGSREPWLIAGGFSHVC